jgi:hypothetical protein
VTASLAIRVPQTVALSSEPFIFPVAGGAGLFWIHEFAAPSAAKVPPSAERCLAEKHDHTGDLFGPP